MHFPNTPLLPSTTPESEKTWVGNYILASLLNCVHWAKIAMPKSCVHFVVRGIVSHPLIVEIEAIFYSSWPDSVFVSRGFFSRLDPDSLSHYLSHPQGLDGTLSTAGLTVTLVPLEDLELVVSVNTGSGNCPDSCTKEPLPLLNLHSALEYKWCWTDFHSNRHSIGH